MAQQVALAAAHSEKHVAGLWDLVKRCVEPDDRVRYEALLEADRALSEAQQRWQDSINEPLRRRFAKLEKEL